MCHQVHVPDRKITINGYPRFFHDIRVFAASSNFFQLNQPALLLADIDTPTQYPIPICPTPPTKFCPGPIRIPDKVSCSVVTVFSIGSRYDAHAPHRHCPLAPQIILISDREQRSREQCNDTMARDPSQQGGSGREA